MDAIKGLKEKFLQAGGTQVDFEDLGDTGLQDGSARPIEARTVALKCFRQGALIRMGCYDGRGRNQGEAVIVFEHWLDKDLLVFRGQHCCVK